MIAHPPPLVIPERPALIRPAPKLAAPAVLRRNSRLILDPANFPPTIGLPPLAPLVASYVTLAGNTSNQSSYSLPGVSFGVEADDRDILIWLAQLGPSNASVTSFTIGGQTAVRKDGGSSTTNLQAWMARVSAGPTGTIAVNFSSSRYGIYAFVYRMTGLRSQARVDWNSDGTSPYQPNVNTEDGGAVFAASITTSTGSNGSWTGLTRDTEAINGTAFRAGCASASNVPQATPRSIAVTGHELAAAISFR
jgi:hypothetical protein